MESIRKSSWFGCDTCSQGASSSHSKQDQSEFHASQPCLLDLQELSIPQDKDGGVGYFSLHLRQGRFRDSVAVCQRERTVRVEWIDALCTHFPLAVLVIMLDTRPGRPFVSARRCVQRASVRRGGRFPPVGVMKRRRLRAQSIFSLLLRPSNAQESLHLTR